MAEVKRQGWQQFQNFSPAKTIETLDRAGVSTAFLSVTEPGVWYGDDFSKERQDAIGMARDLNDYGARMVSDYKGRFGLFAVLLPCVPSSVLASLITALTVAKPAESALAVPGA